MTLQAVLDSLDDVPEALREFYTESEDGKFRLDVTGVEFPDEVKGLKSALKKERERRKELADRVATIPEGFDAHRWQELLDAEEARERQAAEKKGEWEKLRDKLQEKHEKQLADKDGVIHSLERQLEDLLVDNVARDAITKAEASVTLLLPHVKQRTKVIEENGKKRPIVIDSKGERRLNDAGADMTIEELVVELGEDTDFAMAFAPSGATGGGASGRSGAGGATSVRSRADLATEADKAAFITKHGVDAFLALPAK